MNVVAKSVGGQVLEKKRKNSGAKIKDNQFSVYRQLEDSNSQWHKELQKVPVAGIVSLGKCQLRKCQLGEVPVEGLAPVRGKNLALERTIFSNFVLPFQPWMTFNKIYENIKKHHPVRISYMIEIFSSLKGFN